MKIPWLEPLGLTDSSSYNQHHPSWTWESTLKATAAHVATDYCQPHEDLCFSINMLLASESIPGVSRSGYNRRPCA